MPDGTNGGVTITHDGPHLRVDARPARLVSMLKSDDGAPVVTAQPASGDVRSQELPGGVRQATFQIRDDVTVEATPAATFVAIAEKTGRCLVIAYGGEVTVVPGGDDRFALAANEALVIGGSAGEPTVVPVAELSASSHPDMAELLDATSEAVFAPSAAADAPKAPTDAKPPADAPVTEERTVGVTPTDDKPAPAAGGAKKAATTPAKSATTSAPGAAGAAGAPGGGRRKKGKKGRPQPQKSGGAKKAAVGAGAAAGVTGAAGAAGAASAAKKAAAKAAAGGGGKQPPKDPPKSGGGGGGGHDDDSYEDTPRDKRFLVGAVLVALVLAVGAVLLLSNVGDDSTEVATEDVTSTTEDEPADTTTSSTTPETTTTAAPTTTARATTTTAPATTTTARATTTTVAPQPRYSIEPKSCVQNGNSITYTASVKNDASTAYDFTVDVSFKTSDGTEVAKATANVTRLAPGRTADFSATGTSSRNLAGTGASCVVTRVDARPSA